MLVASEVISGSVVVSSVMASVNVVSALSGEFSSIGPFVVLGCRLGFGVVT